MHKILKTEHKIGKFNSEMPVIYQFLKVKYILNTSSKYVILVFGIF